MEFIITSPALKPKYFNSYVVECTGMFGDADGYGEVDVGGFEKGKDEELLKEFVGVCIQMKKADEQEYFQDVEGFAKWFDNENLSEEDYEELPDKVKELTADWLREPQSFGEYYASFDGYKVYYYDGLGVKYNVQVVL